MKVTVIRAHNTADFDDWSITVAGTNEEFARQKLTKALTELWNAKSSEDQAFYETFYNFESGWNLEINECEVEGTWQTWGSK